MNEDFQTFADRVLVALADEAAADPEALAPDLKDLCERRSIAFNEAWLRELPGHFVDRGWGTAESTMESWRVRIRGNGLERAAELRRSFQVTAVAETSARNPVPIFAPLYGDKAESRFDYLMNQALEEMPTRLKALYLEQAGKGLLESGSTIKQAVRAVEELSERATAAALDAISRATSGQGRRRRRLLTLLDQKSEQFFERVDEYLTQDLKQFRLEGDLMRPLLVEVKRRRLHQVDQYRGGWTAPPPKPFKEKYPLLNHTVTALVSAVIGAAVALLLK